MSVSQLLRLLALSMMFVACCSGVWLADLCVNASGKGGCFTTLSSAVASAASGDVIRVARGIYREDVVILTPLSLLDEGAENTIIHFPGDKTTFSSATDSIFFRL